MYKIVVGVSLTYAGFKKHLTSVHEKDLLESGDAANSESVQANFLQDNIEVGETSVTHSPEAGCFDDNGSGLYKQNTKMICASIIAKLQGSGMANNVVSTIVSDLEELATGLHSQVRHEILSAVPIEDPVRSTLEESLQNCVPLFSL